MSPELVLVDAELARHERALLNTKPYLEAVARESLGEIDALFTSALRTLHADEIDP